MTGGTLEPSGMDRLLREMARRNRARRVAKYMSEGVDRETAEACVDLDLACLEEPWDGPEDVIEPDLGDPEVPNVDLGLDFLD